MLTNVTIIIIAVSAKRLSFFPGRVLLDNISRCEPQPEALKSLFPFLSLAFGFSPFLQKDKVTSF